MPAVGDIIEGTNYYYRVREVRNIQNDNFSVDLFSVFILDWLKTSNDGTLSTIEVKVGGYQTELMTVGSKLTVSNSENGEVDNVPGIGNTPVYIHKVSQAEKVGMIRFTTTVPLKPSLRLSVDTLRIQGESKKPREYTTLTEGRSTKPLKRTFWWYESFTDTVNDNFEIEHFEMFEMRTTKVGIVHSNTPRFVPRSKQWISTTDDLQDDDVVYVGPRNARVVYAQKGSISTYTMNSRTPEFPVGVEATLERNGTYNDKAIFRRYAYIERIDVVNGGSGYWGDLTATLSDGSGQTITVETSKGQIVGIQLSHTFSMPFSDFSDTTSVSGIDGTTYLFGEAGQSKTILDEDSNLLTAEAFSDAIHNIAYAEPDGIYSKESSVVIESERVKGSGAYVRITNDIVSGETVIDLYSGGKHYSKPHFASDVPIIAEFETNEEGSVVNLTVISSGDLLPGTRYDILDVDIQDAEFNIMFPTTRLVSEGAKYLEGERYFLRGQTIRGGSYYKLLNEVNSAIQEINKYGIRVTETLPPKYYLDTKVSSVREFFLEEDFDAALSAKRVINVKKESPFIPTTIVSEDERISLKTDVMIKQANYDAIKPLLLDEPDSEGKVVADIMGEKLAIQFDFMDTDYVSSDLYVISSNNSFYIEVNDTGNVVPGEILRIGTTIDVFTVVSIMSETLLEIDVPLKVPEGTKLMGGHTMKMTIYMTEFNPEASYTAEIDDVFSEQLGVDGNIPNPSRLDMSPMYYVTNFVQWYRDDTDGTLYIVAGDRDGQNFASSFDPTGGTFEFVYETLYHGEATFTVSYSKITTSLFVVNRKIVNRYLIAPLENETFDGLDRDLEEIGIYTDAQPQIRQKIENYRPSFSTEIKVNGRGTLSVKATIFNNGEPIYQDTMRCEIKAVNYGEAYLTRKSYEYPFDSRLARGFESYGRDSITTFEDSVVSIRNVYPSTSHWIFSEEAIEVYCVNKEESETNDDTFFTILSDKSDLPNSRMFSKNKLVCQSSFQRIAGFYYRITFIENISPMIRGTEIATNIIVHYMEPFTTNWMIVRAEGSLPDFHKFPTVLAITRMYAHRTTGARNLPLHRSIYLFPEEKSVTGKGNNDANLKPEVEYGFYMNGVLDSKVTPISMNNTYTNEKTFTVASRSFNHGNNKTQFENTSKYVWIKQNTFSLGKITIETGNTETIDAIFEYGTWQTIGILRIREVKVFMQSSGQQNAPIDGAEWEYAIIARGEDESSAQYTLAPFPDATIDNLLLDGDYTIMIRYVVGGDAVKMTRDVTINSGAAQKLRLEPARRVVVGQPPVRPDPISQKLMEEVRAKVHSCPDIKIVTTEQGKNIPQLVEAINVAHYIFSRIILAAPRKMEILVEMKTLPMGTIGLAKDGKITLSPMLLRGMAYLNDFAVPRIAVTLIHEVLHILGMGTTELWDSMIDDDGNYVGKHGVDGYFAVLEKNGYSVKNLPIRAMPVEDGFEDTTRGKHAEEEGRIVHGHAYPAVPNEIMTGMMESKTYITSMTLGVLQDLRFAVRKDTMWVRDTGITLHRPVSEGTAATQWVPLRTKGSAAAQGVTLQTGQTVYAAETHVDGTTYQWKRNQTEIEGATDREYTITNDDIGYMMYVVVSTASSSETLLVPGGTVTITNSSATGDVTITGRMKQGELLTAEAVNVQDADGLATATFQFDWYHASSIPSESANPFHTGSTYTLRESDVNKTIVVKASFTDDQGTQERLYSAATSAVENVDDPGNDNRSLAVSGDFSIGGTLTAFYNPVGFDSDGVNNVSFAWYFDDDYTLPTAGETFVIPNSASGKRLNLRMTYTDNYGTLSHVEWADAPLLTEPYAVPSVLPVAAYVEARTLEFQIPDTATLVIAQNPLYTFTGTTISNILPGTHSIAWTINFQAGYSVNGSLDFIITKLTNPNVNIALPTPTVTDNVVTDYQLATAHTITASAKAGETNEIVYSNNSFIVQNTGTIVLSYYFAPTPIYTSLNRTQEVTIVTVDLPDGFTNWETVTVLPPGPWHTVDVERVELSVTVTTTSLFEKVYSVAEALATITVSANASDLRLQDGGSEAFEIVDNGDGTSALQLKAGTELDHETAPTLACTIVAEGDPGEEVLFPYTLTVNDVETLTITDVGIDQELSPDSTAAIQATLDANPIYHKFGTDFDDFASSGGIQNTGDTVDASSEAGEYTLRYAASNGQEVTRLVIVPFSITNLKKVYTISELQDGQADFQLKKVRDVTITAGEGLTLNADTEDVVMTFQP